MKLTFTATTFVALLGWTGCTEGFAFGPTTIGSRTSQRSTTTFLFSTNNNVVLRPSEDPTAFDSLKIGTARVHRYRRENDPESETEYVMWYHGRSLDLDADKTLPPLSTGRIGRASSKNGLLWKKDVIGSLSEDVADCTLGLNNESWWGFDTAHVGLGSVLLPMTTPAIMTEGGVYLMYYMGGNFDETFMADYTTREGIPTDAKIKGMKLKIGVCVSQDGITWGRVEGDDPTGACIAPYDIKDPNSVNMLAKTPLGLLKEELYCGWPEVVVKIAEKKNEQSGFFMYYSTMTKGDKEKCIAYATSPDGFRWSKQGICLTPSPSSDNMDNDGCARCNVVRNAIFNDKTSTWEDMDGYTMYYEGVSKADGKHRILMATSDDGNSWTKGGVVLDAGSSEEAWDCQGVGSPNVLRMCDGSQRMYYAGQGVGGSTAIGAAKLDQDSEVWVREQATFVFAEA